MAITAPPDIDALPNPPDPNDRSTFNQRAYPWSVAQQTLATQLGAVADNVFDNATEAATAATTATTQAQLATTQAGIATTAASSATTQDGIATTQAGIATTQAGIATTQAGIATTKAAEAAASVASISSGPVTSVNSKTGVVTLVPADIGLETASQVEMEAGTETALRAMSPLRVAQAIAFLGSARAGDLLTTTRTLAAPNWLKCDGSSYLRSSYPAVEAPLPSPKGIIWTQRTLPTSSDWQSITYGNGLFVAVAYSGIAATSPDGITWTQRTLPTSTGWQSVTYGNGLFVAVATSSSIAATSPDGITWTQRTLPVSANWRSVTYGNGLFVALAYGSSIAATSLDGITWTQRTLPVSTNWISVTYGNGLFVAVAYSNSIAATSPDDPTKFVVPLITAPALCSTYIKATA